MKVNAAIAISGGIDSLAAAFILKKQVQDVVGLYFINGYEPPPYTITENSGRFKKPDLPVSVFKLPKPHPLYGMQQQLDIPIFLVDVRQYFEHTIVDYFMNSYKQGLTPNPCLWCNARIKFGILAEVAEKMGADCLATGHYARTININGRYFLQKGRDKSKDQSYFLAFVNQNILPLVRFPLGAMTKKEVTQLAAENHLVPLTQKESQDVCFIRDNNYARFISSRQQAAGSPGDITTPDGTRIGTHPGLHHFTIGQRRGINCPAKHPYYVVGIDIRRNQLMVGEKKDLYKSSLTLRDINWFIPPPSHPFDQALSVSVKIRYRHPAAAATLFPKKDNTAVITFETPQQAITPGQGAVCYIDDKIIAAGWIGRMDHA